MEILGDLIKEFDDEKNLLQSAFRDFANKLFSVEIIVNDFSKLEAAKVEFHPSKVECDLSFSRLRQLLRTIRNAAGNLWKRRQTKGIQVIL